MAKQSSVELNSSQLNIALFLSKQDLFLLLGGRQIDVFENGFRAIHISVKPVEEEKHDGKGK